MSVRNLVVPALLSLVLSGCAGPADPQDDPGQDSFEESSGPPQGGNSGGGDAGKPTSGGPGSATPAPSSSPPPQQTPPQDQDPDEVTKEVEWTDGQIGGRAIVCHDAGCNIVDVSEDKSRKQIELGGALKRGSLNLTWTPTIPSTNNKLTFSIRSCLDPCPTVTHSRKVTGPSPLPLEFSFDDWPANRKLLIQVSPVSPLEDAGPYIDGAYANVIIEQPFEVRGQVFVEPKK